MIPNPIPLSGLHRCRILGGIALMVFSGQVHAADWPAFRGPLGSGAAVDASIPKELKIRWSAPLQGRGLSSPVIRGGKIFLTSASGPSQDQLRVLCLDRESGKVVWERQLRATGRTMAHPKTCVAANTPCTDGKNVYALWSSNDLVAFDQNGGLLWVRGLTEDYSNASNSLGMASSPIIAGDTLIVMIENDSESYSLGVDVRTGKNRWKLNRPKAANWSSPAIIPGHKGKSPEVILQSTKLVTAVESDTGKISWEMPMNASSMSSPVVQGNVAYLSASGITALRLPATGQQPETVWNSRQMNPATISPLLLGNSLFSMNGAGVLMKANVSDGNVLWKLRLTGPFSASPVGAGERVVVVNEKGLVQIVDLTAPEGAVLSQLQLPLDEPSKEVILSTPALSREFVFVRSDSHLWCLAP